MPRRQALSSGRPIKLARSLSGRPLSPRRLEGKALPDFSHTDTYQVSRTLHGEVRDPAFVRFLERVGRESATSFDTHDFLVLDLVRCEELVPAPLRGRLRRRLAELGVVESVGRGRGIRFLLARRLYRDDGRPRSLYVAAPPRPRDAQGAATEAFTGQSGRESDPSFKKSSPGISRANVQRLLNELRCAGQVRLVGQRRGRGGSRSLGQVSGTPGNEA